MPGTISVRMRGSLERAQQRRQSGKVGKRIAEHADAHRRERARPTVREALDLVAAAAHEQRRVVDEPSDDFDAVCGQIARKSGGASSATARPTARSASRPPIVSSLDRRVRARDADQHGCAHFAVAI